MAKILIIDDDVQFRKMLSQVLKRAGYEISEAEDGNEGTRIYETEPIDLVITDLIMPKKEGIETISELKKKYPDIKIIAISGGGRVGPESYLTFAEKLGALYTFSKPLDRDKVLEAVHELISE